MPKIKTVEVNIRLLDVVGSYVEGDDLDKGERRKWTTAL